jgi:hypothetical protein
MVVLSARVGVGSTRKPVFLSAYTPRVYVKGGGPKNPVKRILGFFFVIELYIVQNFSGKPLQTLLPIW